MLAAPRLEMSLLCALLGLSLLGCANKSASASRAAEVRATRAAPAAAGHGFSTGGNAAVNGRAYDATFFKDHGTNPFVDSDDDHLSTFAIDVDTASYAVTRAYLTDGNLPPAEAVRAEEFINSFPYDYPAPRNRDLAIHLEGAPSQFGRNRHLLRVGLKAREVARSDRQDAVLTFVVDVSGSMATENRLALVQKSLRYLVEQLGPGDRIGIVTYGSTAEVALRHQDVGERDEILDAIDDLTSGGSTNAEDGLRQGYELAAKAYRPNAVNRVILCTDGVANVGQTGPDAILNEIRRYVKNGITLTALGFGMENFNDVLLEQLGDQGNGHYAYVDTMDEARRLFGRDLTATLQVVARDVKVQVDFNPETVRSYRLLGYENRDVRDDQFRDRKADGGEAGAGHRVTALYEVKTWDGEDGHAAREGRLATVRVHWRKADGGGTDECSETFETHDLARDFDATSDDFQMAVAAGEFAEILRDSPWAKERSLDWVLELARGIGGELGRSDEVREFIGLVEKARRLRKDDGRGVTQDVGGGAERG